MERVSLGRRMLVANLVLILGILVLASASLWGLWGLRGRVLDVANEYDEVLLVEGALRHVTAAMTCVMISPVDSTILTSELAAARHNLDTFRSFQDSEGETDVEHQKTELALVDTLLASIDTSLETLESMNGASWSEDARVRLQGTLDLLLRDLLQLEAATDVEGARSSATTAASVTIGVIAAFSCIFIISAIVVSVMGYRRVMSPLRQLQEGVRRIAAGRFQHRLDVGGDREFIELSDDFNRMATELDTLYRVMEEKVAQKSRDLVRSERLASVGFLAAGVAHEINNPLSIMSGYAEMAKKWLDGSPDHQRLEETREALDTIRAEAFRCKGITEQLLSLSRSGEDARCPVALGRIASDVVTLASGLKGYRERRIALNCQLSDDMTVMGNEAELKQVVLNLIVNAMQATEPDVGRVDVTLQRCNEWVELSVTDNGCGIDAASLPNVFEPFWTNRRHDEKLGFGLGLSISHAIVEGHGGRLSAESDGKEKGSRFLLTLPLATTECGHD